MEVALITTTAKLYVKEDYNTYLRSVTNTGTEPQSVTYDCIFALQHNKKSKTRKEEGRS